MRLWFAAEEESRYKITKRFVRWWQILGFIVVAMFLLWFFFPQDELLQDIAQQQQADKIARQYLHNLVDLYPQKKEYNLLLIEQDLKFGKLSKAVAAIMPFLVKKPTTKTDWQALMLYYEILRVETYAKPEVSYARKQGLLKMRDLIAILKQGQLNAEDLLRVGDDLVEMGENKSALEVYQRVLVLRDKKCIEDCAQLYAAAGRFMLAYSDYKASAEFYFLAQVNAKTLAAQRDYFMAAVKSLQSGNLLDLALAEGRKHIRNLADDKDTLLFLSNLALAANKPKLAHDFMKRVVRLKISP